MGRSAPGFRERPYLVKQKMNASGGVGKRLLRLRKQKNLSLVALSVLSGVSTGMISQIERGVSNPSIRILERLRLALLVPLTTLLEDNFVFELPSDHQTVRKRGEGPLFRVGDTGVKKQLLSPHGDHDLQVMIVSFPPRSSAEEMLIGAGEKAGLVLEGIITLSIDGVKRQLITGDSFQFKSALPHSICNETDAEARCLWIMNTKQNFIHL